MKYYQFKLTNHRTKTTKTVIAKSVKATLLNYHKRVLPIIREMYPDFEIDISDNMIISFKPDNKSDWQVWISLSDVQLMG